MDEAIRAKIIDALTWRYAVKVFDSTKQVHTEDLHTLLEVGRLAPSTAGIEPWKFIVIENKELRRKIRVAAWDQPKVTDASYLIVFAYRTDIENLPGELVNRTAVAQQRDTAELEGLRQMARSSTVAPSALQAEAVAKAQVYIPLGMMLEAAALMGIDAGPMEGFAPDQVDKLLGLEAKHLKSTALLALGYRGDDPHAARPKVRRSFSEAVEFIR